MVDEVNKVFQQNEEVVYKRLTVTGYDLIREYLDDEKSRVIAYRIYGIDKSALDYDPDLKLSDLPEQFVVYHCKVPSEMGLFNGFINRGIQNGWIEGDTKRECLDYMVDHGISLGVPEEWLR